MDLLTIGDISIDLFMKVSDAEVHCNIEKEDCKISFDYGEKIPVEEFKMTVAGNAANVASGAAKLGLKAAIYTEVGNDLNAEFAQRELDKRGVNTGKQGLGYGRPSDRGFQGRAHNFFPPHRPHLQDAPVGDSKNPLLHFYE